MMNDRTQAEALRISEEYLKRSGWKFTPEAVGTTAAKIIGAFNAELDKTAPIPTPKRRP